MRKVDLLRELQEVDSALDRARAELEERSVRLGDDSELVPLREEMERARAELKAVQKKGQELEWDLEKRAGRVKDEEKKLYGGTVKNPKELASLAHEVEHEKQQISAIETDALLNMDAREDASRAAQAAERAHAAKDAEWKAEQAQLKADAESLERQVKELSARRAEIAARVDPSSARTYESLRRTRGGLAVVPVEQRTCKGCRITLSSSEVQRARASTDLVACQSCGRILYVPS